MSKQRLFKKRVIIPTVIIIVLLAGAAGAYYWYRQLSSAPAAPPSAAAQTEAKNLGLAGNQTLTAQYIDRINAKNAAAAQQLFDTALAKAPNAAARQALLSQNITVALAYRQTDAAEQAALAAIKADPSYATYNDAYRVYLAKQDYAKQQDMLQKAITAVKSENQPNKDQLIATLESRLHDVQQRQAGLGSQ